jgi:methylenetetrahydrofolate dehydrogenase (NADP+)/methenyltetrahydrofolate cyclohydrolase
VNIGRLVSGIPALAPCTPKGIMTLLRHENIALSGKHAVVVGRSVLFGKPMGQMLLNANCTVTYCHSKTNDLPSMTRQADILIAAAGQADFIKDNWVKKGVIVIDGGINRLENGSITGDVDFESVKHVAAAITPVPGGVGPMTVASLLENTYQAASLIRT